MKNRQLFRTMNLLAYVATLIINGLANALPLNGLSTGEISDRFDVFFVPAGYVFSIWGVIYLALGAFAVYQILPSQRENALLDRIGYWFAFSAAANIAWIFLWHFEIFPLTVVAMGLLLISLIVIYLRLDIGRGKPSRGDRWFVKIPFQIYLGWIAVATIANMTSLLDFIGWNGWGISPELWAVVMLSVGALVGMLISFIRFDEPFVLVLIWAFAGIAIKHVNTPLVLSVSAGIAVLLGVIMLFNSVRKSRQSTLFPR
ncbi:MAG: hypothetical protein JXA97_00300 [Anaerolineales bacterium]|nr:hypothetical protein [Anaerolineales bacterium]